uniref:Peptidase S53 domain-containing protein n=1 Tax=viral metagenome TaxID=1070528 RepID=A0A6C0DCV1_9ZZZZ
MTLLFTNKYNKPIKKQEKQPLKAKKFTKLYVTPNFNQSTIANFPPQYFSGTQLRTLYNVPTVVNSTNKKTTIAIIIAFTYPGLKNDLKTYWQNPINFGSNSTPPNINIYTMPGATQNTGWAQEECLDVQMVCTMNPNAIVWVVEAKSDLVTDLMNAMAYTNNVIKPDIISMSWGINEVPELLNFTKYFTNNSISYCAASGDNNFASWPATLSNCIAVGGTTLLWTPNDTPSRTEYAWDSAGCGYSCIINQPTYQSNITNILRKNRAIPDLSMIADTNSSVYTVYNGNWYGIGGTSVSTPIFAGILSLANQLRFNNKKSSLTSVYSSTPNNTLSNYVPSPNNIQNFIYKTIYPNSTLYGNTFYDVTIGSIMGSVGGSSNNLTNYNSGSKFDITTGMGSPNATFLCNQLLNL